MPATQRRRRPLEDSDSDQDVRRRRLASPGDSDEDMEGEETGGKTADMQLAKKLVRYAISCEHSRMAIRRDGIKERVLGNQGRSFKRIFALAQKQLRDFWGMEMRELPVREKVTLQEKRAAMKSQSQPKTGSGTYILSSTIPDAYRTAAIIPPSRAPSSSDEAVYLGFYTLIVALIWLSGGELSEEKLKRFLSRVNADRNVSSEKTEVVLKRMEKHGYVVKRNERPQPGQQETDASGTTTTTWHVGPRAKEEIGVDGVVGVVREVFGEAADESVERAMRASLGIKTAADREEGQEEDEEEKEAASAPAPGEKTPEESEEEEG